MHIWQTNPFENVVLTRGEGCIVWDDRGNSYLDLLAGCWCTVLGHGHPRLLAAIEEQAGKLIHTGPPFLSDEIHRASAKLAEILHSSLDRAVFLNTGSEAVELALKMARAATGADAIVIIERSYYGATTYALSLSEAGRDVTWLPRVGTAFRIPAPDCRKCPAGAQWPCGDFPCLDALRGLVHEKSNEVAAVIFEPVLANGGVIVPPVGYGARLRELAAQMGALFIAEEVTTGMGRTGRWFGFEHEDIVPDILVIGKAVGAGLPVAAVVTTEEVETRCAGKLTHVQSHQNDAFSGSIVATVISILQEEGLVERVADLGDYLLTGLKELQSRHPSIVDVRGRGLMLGIELDQDHSRKGAEVGRQLLEAGFIVNYQPQNAAFRLFPPYVISKEQINEFLGAFDNALAMVS
ncbi:MAG: aspartate aminotransferase family protein [Phycisphaerales bacterium]|nr:MAG: aspartate aminotransferase family protein [Phycisphaerales bacterium]